MFRQPLGKLNWYTDINLYIVSRLLGLGQGQVFKVTQYIFKQDTGWDNIVYIDTSACILLRRKGKILFHFISGAFLFNIYSGSLFLCQFSCACWYCAAVIKESSDVHDVSQSFETNDSFDWLKSHESLSSLTPSLTHLSDLLLLPGNAFVQM